MLQKTSSIVGHQADSVISQDVAIAKTYNHWKSMDGSGVALELS